MKEEIVSTIINVDQAIHDKLVNEEAQEQTITDTVLKWAPFGLLVAYDIYGIKAKSSAKHHIVQMIAGQILLNAVISPLKKSINRRRPNGRYKSFPSRHTATGFLASAIIHKELSEHRPELMHTGYALSLATGWLRMYRKKHWFTDVIGGAVMGMFFGRLSCGVICRVKRR